MDPRPLPPKNSTDNFSQLSTALSPAADTPITDHLKEDNWVANLPPLLRYSQAGDVIQVPNASILALAERCSQGSAAEKPIQFVLPS